MIDFIVNLELALVTAGLEYELRYLPDKGAYVLSIDGTEAFITSVKEAKNDQN